MVFRSSISVRSTRSLAGVAAFAIPGTIILTLAGCGTPYQAREHITLTAPLPVAKLVVESAVGEVFIRADENATEIRAEIVKIGHGATNAEAVAALRQIRTSLAAAESESGTVFARADHPKPSAVRRYEVQWRLIGPPNLVLDVHNRIGDLDVDGMKGGALLQVDVGDVSVSGTNEQFVIRVGVGGVQLSDTNGPVDVRVGTGDVRLREARGPATINTNIGEVRAEDVAGGLNAATNTGSIRAEASGNLELRTSVGDVTLRIRPDQPGSIVAVTGTGSLHVQVPTYRRGRLVADTDVGSLSIRLENLTMQNVRHRRHHFEADLNGGLTPTIDLTTHVGDLTVESYSSVTTTP